MATIKKLYENTWVINEPGRFSNVKMYLLTGSEKGVLIDSGYGSFDLASMVRKVYKGPVTILNTHAHLDHIGGNQYFPSYLPQEDLYMYDKQSDAAFLKSYKLFVFPKAEVRVMNFSCMDLGGRILEIISTPGHTKGSVSILDAQNKAVFIGDTVNPISTWLGTEDSTSITEYKASLERLIHEIKERGILAIYSGHSFGAMRLRTIEDYHHCCEIILADNKQRRFVDMGLNKGYNTRYRFSIITWQRKS